MNVFFSPANHVLLPRGIHHISEIKNLTGYQLPCSSRSFAHHCVGLRRRGSGTGCMDENGM